MISFHERVRKNQDIVIVIIRGRGRDKNFRFSGTKWEVIVRFQVDNTYD